jgi:hypothetical protein
LNSYEFLCDVIARRIIAEDKITNMQVQSAMEQHRWELLRRSICNVLEKLDPAALGTIAASGKADPTTGVSLYAILQDLPAYPMGSGREYLEWLAFGSVAARMVEILYEPNN